MDVAAAAAGETNGDMNLELTSRTLGRRCGSGGGATGTDPDSFVSTIVTHRNPSFLGFNWIEYLNFKSSIQSKHKIQGSSNSIWWRKNEWIEIDGESKIWTNLGFSGLNIRI